MCVWGGQSRIAEVREGGGRSQVVESGGQSPQVKKWYAEVHLSTIKVYIKNAYSTIFSHVWALERLPGSIPYQYILCVLPDCCIDHI